MVIHFESPSLFSIGKLYEIVVTEGTCFPNKFHKAVVCGEKLFERNLHLTNGIQMWFAPMCISWPVLVVKVKIHGNKEFSSSDHFPVRGLRHLFYEKRVLERG